MVTGRHRVASRCNSGGCIAVEKEVPTRRLQSRFGSKVQVEWLPVYAPDLNPVEQVWSHTKYADLANYIPDDIDALAEAVMHSIEQTGCGQALLRSFFRHAGLKL